jgi:hypothetical protein
MIIMIYQIRVHGQPTIFYDDVVSVKADSPEEAKEMAQDAFREILDERFGWADIDIINADIIKEG